MILTISQTGFLERTETMMSAKRSEQTASLSATCRQEKGFVLVSVVILLALLTVIGMTGFTMTHLEVEMSANQNSSKKAFYLADSGLQRAIKKLADDSSWPSTLSNSSDAFAGDNSLGAGNYVVEVFDDDPNPGEVRIRSTGVTVGLHGASATLEVVGEKSPSPPPIMDWALFNCGDLSLTDGQNDISNGDVFVSGNLDMNHGEGNNRIEDGDVWVGGNVNIYKGWVRPGDVFSNGNVNLNATLEPNVDGNVTAGGSVTNPVKASGTVTLNVGPGVVPDYCTGTELAKLAVTAEELQDYRDNADSVISGNYNQSGGDITYTGVVHVTSNAVLNGNMTLTGNVIFVVDGNVEITSPGKIQSSPPGATVTFLVPYGNMKIQGEGDFFIDGNVQVGTVNEDETGIQGGNFQVLDEARVQVTGSVATVNGNLIALGETIFGIDYSPPIDPNLGGGSAGAYTALQWREVRN